ncbi:MAG: glycoside hydrolase family 3 C-terminal domain-containing protein, partial [Acidimicrobiales bacterium]
PDAVEQAVRAATAADVAVVVVGRDDPETEGLDAASMDLPPEQVELIDRVAAANPRTIVAVNTASPVTMDWADDVAAVVQLSYLGQETGTALAAVVFGDVDASGRLTTTHPRRIEDAPAHPHFPGRDGSVEYAEGIFMGYRHYDRNGVDPRWCFGHGLSFTTFAYGELTVGGRADDPAAVSVSVDVTNTGDRTGCEVVQLYVRPVDSPVARPDRELKAFDKITLDPGETTTVSLGLDERSFSHWDSGRRSWHAAPGPYEILVGSSSREIHRTAAWTLTGGGP